MAAVEASIAGGQWSRRRWSVFNNNDLSESAGVSVSPSAEISPSPLSSLDGSSMPSAPSSYSIPNSFVPAPVLVHLLMSLVPCIVVECSDWRCRAEQGELEVARVARVKFLSRDACVREDIAVRSPPSRRAAVGLCQRGEQGNTAKRRTLQPGDAVAQGRSGPPSEFLSRDACASGEGCHRSSGHQSAGRRGRRIWQGDVLFQSLSPSPHPTHPTIQPPPSSGFLSRDGCPSGRALRRGEIPSSSRRAAS